MGGTTAKVCLIDDYHPQSSRTFEVARVGRFKKGSGLPLRIPVIEMVEIGAGGGSLAHIDPLGMIAVGPESAGSDPGPACYGRGGQHPAVTDANLALGRYEPKNFAGGTMSLDEPAAERRPPPRHRHPLGLNPGMAALGVVEMVDENMANAARVHAIESGKNYTGRTLIAFGGGGPVHAYRVAEKIGIDRILVPIGAGVGSAIGFLRAPVAYEVVRSLYQRLGTFNRPAVTALLNEMQPAKPGRRRRPRPLRRPHHPVPPRLHALRRPGPRDPRHPPRPATSKSPTSTPSARSSTPNTPASTTAPSPAPTSRS